MRLRSVGHLVMSPNTAGRASALLLVDIFLFGGRESSLRNRGNVVDMVAQCNEEVKEELTASSMHLKLHCAASLESAPAADDECEIVCSEFRVSVWCVGIGISC
jgi:hypothetical protein